MRKYIKLIFVISISLCLGLVFLIGIYIPSKEIYEREPKRYIATADVSMKWNQPDGFNGSETFIVSGSYLKKFYGAWIHFNLSDRPVDWKSVEISLYNFDSGGEYYFKGIALYLIAYKHNWNDAMNHTEFKAVIKGADGEYMYYWRETNLGYNIYLHKEIGLQRINITHIIKDYPYMFSLTLILSGMRGGSGYCRIYSREANINKTWLPQLIYT